MFDSLHSKCPDLAPMQQLKQHQMTQTCICEAQPTHGSKRKNVSNKINIGDLYYITSFLIAVFAAILLNQLQVPILQTKYGIATQSAHNTLLSKTTAVICKLVHYVILMLFSYWKTVLGPAKSMCDWHDLSGPSSTGRSHQKHLLQTLPHRLKKVQKAFKFELLQTDVQHLNKYNFLRLGSTNLPKHKWSAGTKCF